MFKIWIENMKQSSKTTYSRHKYVVHNVFWCKPFPSLAWAEKMLKNYLLTEYVQDKEKSLQIVKTPLFHNPNSYDFTIWNKLRD